MRVVGILTLKYSQFWSVSCGHLKKMYIRIYLGYKFSKSHRGREAIADKKALWVLSGLNLNLEFLSEKGSNH